MASLRAATAKGTVTLNPISGIHTKPDTYKGRVERKNGLKIKQAKLPLSQASKQANAKRTMRRPQQRAQRSPLSCNER